MTFDSQKKRLAGIDLPKEKWKMLVKVVVYVIDAAKGWCTTKA
jgi:hypothetical protein